MDGKSPPYAVPKLFPAVFHAPAIPGIDTLLRPRGAKERNMFFLDPSQLL